MRIDAANFFAREQFMSASLRGLAGGKAAAEEGQQPLFLSQASKTETPSSTKAEDKSELGDQGKKKVDELKKADSQIKQHEMAHLAAAGGYARSGPQYQYVRGPDGNMYAVAGEVAIDTAPVPNDPQATLRKMEVVIRAAMAPADPSAQDRAVAAKAAQEQNRAQQEMVRERMQGDKSGRLTAENADGPTRSYRSPEYSPPTLDISA